MQLRDYQQRAVDECRRRFAAGARSVVLQMPTGSGKTPTAIEVMRLAREKGKRALFLADRRELVNQASKRLAEWGLPHGVVMAGVEGNPGELIQVASKDTLWSRVFASGRQHLPALDLIVVDEAHRASNKSSLAAWDRYPTAKLLGITATPAGPNGKGLGAIYDDLVVGATYAELHQSGALLPSEVYAPSRPDFSRVRHGRDGDFLQIQAAEIMGEAKIIGDVLEHWKRIAAGRRTIVFAQSVEHSISLRAAFRQQGIPAEHVDADTPEDQRQEYFDAFRLGYITVLTNYGILDTGFDAPWCEVVQIVRATEQRTVWMQMAGRVSRPHPGKTVGIVIDHGGNVYRHGYPDLDLPWSLDPERNIREIADEMRSRKDAAERDPVCCPKCFAYREGGRVCPKCGFEVARNAKHVEPQQGTLEFVRRGEKADGNKLGPNVAAWRRILAQMAHRGSTVKAARALFFKQTGQWPDNSFTPWPADHEWPMRVADLWPGFIRRKAKAAP